MNALKCPSCGHVNSTAENFCLNCGTSISMLNQMPPSYAPVSPASQQNQPFQSYNFNVPSNFKAAQHENKLGRNVFIFYKIFCGLVVAISFMPVLFGLLAIIGSGSQPTAKERQDAFNGSLIIIGYGLVYILPYGLGLILPRSRFHWFFGILLLIGSLIPTGPGHFIFIPAAIVLLIFWFRSETKAYFERT